MKKFYTILMMATALVACTREEQPQPVEEPESTPVTYTLTVNATKGDDSTKALSLSGNTLNATWAAGEKVTVYMMAAYPFNPSMTMPMVIGTLEPSNISSDGTKCTLTGELDAKTINDNGGIGNGDALVLRFSGSAGGSGMMGPTPQDGTLATIQDYFDIATANVTVSAIQDGPGGGKIISTSNASFENQKAIVKFTLKDKTGNQIITPTSVSINEEIGGLVQDVNLDGNVASNYAANGNCFYYAISGTSGGDFNGNLTITASDGTFNYTYTKTGITFAAGQYYDITVKMDKVATDLSASATANCYLVKAAGYYKFDATKKGNGAADLAGISKDTDASSIHSAELLWASFSTATAPAADGIIKDIQYKDGYVYFSTANTFTLGNAVIAIKDNANNILWSWHIWVTDYDDTLYLEGTNGVQMMRRNLGAMASGLDQQAFGLYYQWGRKDPFVGPSTGTTLAAVYGTAKTIVVGEVPVETAIQHPTRYYVKYNTSGNWTTGDHWCSDGTNKMTLWSDSGKTIFDPCPQGWRVPTESEITGMGTAKYIFTSDNGFPASGYINTNGAFVNEANGTFWKTTISGNNARIQVVQGDYAKWDRSPDMGFNIRCVQE